MNLNRPNHKMPHLFRLGQFTLLIAFLITAGCSHLKTQPLKNLPPLEYWEIQGKIGVQTGKEGFSSRLFWSLQPEEQEFKLYTGLGQTVARLVETKELASLYIHDQGTYEGSSGDELIKNQLGLDIPLSQLQYWAQGIVTPGAQDTQLNEDGTLATLNYADWQVVYRSYAVHSGRYLPKNITITNQQTTLKLSLTRWRTLD
ncbi:MAG: lipoprotein insertase outer membrane protein LolB [Pseudomonadota bacterium]